MDKEKLKYLIKAIIIKSHLIATDPEDQSETLDDCIFSAVFELRDIITLDEATFLLNKDNIDTLRKGVIRIAHNLIDTSSISDTPCNHCGLNKFCSKLDGFEEMKKVTKSLIKKIQYIKKIENQKPNLN